MPRVAGPPGPIYCWVCGGTIESAGGDEKGKYKYLPPIFVSEKRRWQTAWDNHRARRIADSGPFAVNEPASALDIYFKDQYTWNEFFRLIVVRKNEDYLPSEYQVSGIAWLPGAKKDGKYLLAPKDRSRAYLGTTDWDSKFLAVCPVPHPFAERTQESSRLEGYAIHSRCWTLLEREVGCAPLETIILALRKEWGRITGMPSSLRHDKEYAGIADDDDDEFFRIFQCWPLGIDFTWLPDPIRVREVRTIIRKSVNSLKRKCANPDTRGPVNFLSAKYGVPLEILYLISECLGDIADVQNMLLAFGEQLPQSFWQKHIPGILFETEDMDPKLIDWPFLAISLEKSQIFETSIGIWNRKPVLGMVSPIKQHVAELTSKNE